MNSLPDPSPSSGASTEASSSITAGLTALKQGDYATAIQWLEPVVGTPLTADSSLSDQPALGQSPSDLPERVQAQPLQAQILQAQMGLVVAYERAGWPGKAIALCQSLTLSPNPQAQAWADRNLKTLTKRYPDQRVESPAAAPDQTGFVPFDSAAPARANQAPDDLTGFTPLTSSNAESMTDRAPAKPSTSTPPVPDSAVAARSIPPAPPQDSATAQPTQSAPARPEPGLVADVGSESSAQNRDRPSSSSELTEERESGSATNDAEPPIEPPLREQPIWRQADRARRWQPLKSVNSLHLWALQIGTAIALFWFLYAGLWMVQTPLNALSDAITRWRFPAQYIPEHTVQGSILIWPMLVLMVGSPWLLDWLLQILYGQRPLSTAALATKSLEAERLIQRFCRQQKIPELQLRVLPTAAPIALTYGLIPRTARIVVSQGMLDQLADDEIATLYASELGHIAQWDYLVLSLVVLLIQIPYLLYWRLALWGDRQQNPVLRGLLATLSSLCYGLFWYLRWTGVCLSRWRLYDSDRVAAELTGNPNGLIRALLKTAIGIARDIEKQEQTSALLEGFDLLHPVGYRSALSVGSLWRGNAPEALLTWDLVNPYRRWLAVNNAQPLMGDRLQRIDSYGRHWNLRSELNLAPASSPKPHWNLLVLQAAPLVGLIIGWLIGMALWCVGYIGNRSSLIVLMKLAWLDQNRSILWGAMLIGFGIGMILRFNRLFPDIRIKTLRTQADKTSLPTLLQNPAMLPLDSQPICLTGKLLGRRGVSNWLGQDLILQTQMGLVKLHYVSQLGPLGTLFQAIRPSSLLGQSVLATGWFRRGATPWIDLDALQVQISRRTSQGGYQIWFTTIASLAIVWGLYSLLLG